MPRPSIASSVLCAFAFVAIAGCGGSSRAPVVPPLPPEPGRHQEQIAAQVKPFFDAELVSGLVIGLYDAGRTEVYGFGTGPGGGKPDGATLFDLGPVTKVYTSLLLADAVQRRELSLDTPVAELLPPGVTAPIRDNTPITLGELALHSSGLPQLPPSLVAHASDPDPYGRYNEDMLYRDLIQTELMTRPGTKILYSTYGGGLLGFLLGKKLGGGYAKLLVDRVLHPLALGDTFIAVPDAAKPRRIGGTNDDLAPVKPWGYDALAGAGALVSSAHDQLELIEAELDAALGGSLVLRRAMKLTQEPAFDHTGQNEGLGWLIDSAGRYWHNGSTAGCHAFVGFDPKTKRGVVVLSSTATSLVDRLAEAAYKILDGQSPAPAKLAMAADLAQFVGTYDLTGSKLQVVASGNRLYLDGPGEPRHRLSPVSDHEFWIEALSSFAVFEKSGDKITRVVFAIGDRALPANRVEPN